MAKRLGALDLTFVVALACLVGAGSARADSDEQRSRTFAKKAKAAFGLANYAEAARLYEQAFEARPDASLLYNAAQTHRMGGNKPRALELYRSYVRLYAGAELAPQARQQITDLERQLGPDRPAPPPNPPASPPPPPGPGAGRVSAIAAGGASCASTSAQMEFEAPSAGVDVAHGNGRAFKTPAIDTTRAWCGKGSLRVQAAFNLEGQRIKGTLPAQLGELYIPLPAKVDLTGRTVSARVLVTGPAGFAYGGQIAAAQGEIWVDGTQRQNQPMGRWITFSHTFRADNRVYTGGTSKVDQTEALVLQIWASGPAAQRVWNGTVHIDDLDWR